MFVAITRALASHGESSHSRTNLWVTNIKIVTDKYNTTCQSTWNKKKLSWVSFEFVAQFIFMFTFKFSDEDLHRSRQKNYWMDLYSYFDNNFWWLRFVWLAVTPVHFGHTSDVHVIKSLDGFVKVFPTTIFDDFVSSSRLSSLWYSSWLYSCQKLELKETFQVVFRADH